MSIQRMARIGRRHLGLGIFVLGLICGLYSNELIKLGEEFGAQAFITDDLTVNHTALIQGATARVGIGNTSFTPGSIFTGPLDVRTDNGNIPLVVARYSAGNAGTDLSFVFGNGTIAAPTSTPLGIQSLFLARIYGYDTNNAIAESARIGTIVDQTTAAGTVPGEIYFMNTTNTTNGFGGVGLMRRRFTMDSSGHLASLQGNSAGFPGAIPALSACGTGPVLATNSTDTDGTFTEGTVATGCTLTFAEPFNNPTPACTPTCTFTAHGGHLFTETISATAFTITNIGPLSSEAVDYHCFCYGAGIP